MIALAFYAKYHQELDALLDDTIIFPSTMTEEKKTDIRKMSEMISRLAEKEYRELLSAYAEHIWKLLQLLPCNIRPRDKGRRWDQVEAYLERPGLKKPNNRATLGMTVTSHKSRLVIACWIWTLGGRAVADALVGIIGPTATLGKTWHPDWKHGGTVVLGHHPILPDEVRDVDSQKLCAAITSTFRVLDKKKIREIIELSEKAKERVR